MHTHTHTHTHAHNSPSLSYNDLCSTGFVGVSITRDYRESCIQAVHVQISHELIRRRTKKRKGKYNQDIKHYKCVFRMCLHKHKTHEQV